MQYLDNVRRSRAHSSEAAVRTTATIAAAPTPKPPSNASATWTAGPRLTPSDDVPSAAVTPPPGLRYVPPPPPVTAASLAKNSNIQINKKTAWSSTGAGASVVQRAKAPPGSVAVAAANVGPQTGTATKFMAKELKKQQQAQAQQQSNKNNNSNKQKSELRQLAYGA